MAYRKSQIAIEYSYRVKTRAPETSIFWVNGRSKVRFEHSWREISAAVGIRASEHDQADHMRDVTRWLSDNNGPPWFLVLDNVDGIPISLDPSGHDGEVAEHRGRSFIDYIPQVQHGTVLVTNHNTTCATKPANHCVRTINIAAMDPKGAVSLLRSRYPEANAVEAARLVAELEHVPLAIAQAGAYLQELSPMTSISTYLEQLRHNIDDETSLLNKNDGDLRRNVLVWDSIISTSELSFNYIRTNFKLSAALLSAMAFLHRRAIPQALIESVVGPDAFPEAMQPLLNFSLVRTEIGGRTFEMHRLVQLALRHWLLKEGSDQHWKQQSIIRVYVQLMDIMGMGLPTPSAWILHAEEVSLWQTASEPCEFARTCISNIIFASHESGKSSNQSTRSRM